MNSNIDEDIISPERRRMFERIEAARLLRLHADGLTDAMNALEAAGGLFDVPTWDEIEIRGGPREFVLRNLNLGHPIEYPE